MGQSSQAGFQPCVHEGLWCVWGLLIHTTATGSAEGSRGLLPRSHKVTSPHPTPTPPPPPQATSRFQDLGPGTSSKGISSGSLFWSLPVSADP